MNKIILPKEISEILKNNNTEIIIPESRAHLLELSMGNSENMTFDVSYNVEGKGIVREATVTKCKNGLVVNYDDIYMRRRDPKSMLIGDDLPTDKTRYEDKYNESFDTLRSLTFEWLKSQPSLILMPFMAGSRDMDVGYQSVLIIPRNAAFFAAGLADIQNFIPKSEVPDFFKPKAIVYVAPPFRHTHFKGKQVVVHNRMFDIHEVFSYNLYPGPSAKKGIYAVLLDIGEREKWVTLHASTVRVITPYELTVTIMHEGASGSGKSEMLEAMHRRNDGRLKLGENIVTGEEYLLSITDTCELHPVTDDMALCHPSLQTGSRKLVCTDAEDGWFVRVDHIKNYGTEPNIELNTIHPKQPLLFFNIDAIPGSTALIWEHIMDSEGSPCPNPRLIMPRKFVDNTVNSSVEVDVRSFGIRTPPTTRENPNYGIVGLFHLLPPALAWLWRLVAPRGFANPSITDSGEMKSEGVGSYWPFSTGKMVDQANLLLRQILKTPSTRYVLIPNQYIGAYKVGFSGQWAIREYLARRGGAKFREDALEESRCPLLGYAMTKLKIDGTHIKKGFLQVNLQSEVGNDGYDAGAQILTDFFKKEIQKYMAPGLMPLGQEILEACLKGAPVSEYMRLTVEDGKNTYFLTN
ncbi:MAG: DUF4914 family protein [Clostridiales bacterium]|nr:DUF4914 family protein [Clostridiales bacterium]